MCFQRGFELIKNHLRRKCGRVSRRNQKKNLVNPLLRNVVKWSGIFAGRFLKCVWLFYDSAK